MKKITLLIPVICLFQACTSPSVHKSNTTMLNDHFNQFKNQFVENLWKVYPVWATTVGYHTYDSVLVIPTEESRQNELAFSQQTEDSLKTFKFDSLDANNKTDYRMIINFIDGTRFNINEFKEFEWNPSMYNVGDALFYIMDNKKVSLEERLRNISLRLAQVPAYFEAARINIKRPTKEHTQLAIDQGNGSLYFFKSIFPDSLKKSKLNESEIKEFSRHAALAQQSIEGYVKWLQDNVMSHDSTYFRSFRIGKELYDKKFLIDIDSRWTADEIYQKALDRKNFLHTEMSKLTDQLWNKYLPTVKAPDDTLVKIKMLIDTISVNHCGRNEFMETIEKQLPELIAFINTHHLIDLDSTKPLKVRKTPEYMAGVAGASINAPGPYDRDGNTYYNVTPLTAYSDSDAESYLREYNHYVLQILSIHEAIPGHYTQLIYANRSPSIIKSLFGNNAMIEGWACYVERMMIEQGYNASPEMQLFYDKWNLRETCNFLLDHNIHCENWTKEQVMDLLVREAFQQKAESEEKWKRATLSQVQLACYFTGVTEIYELREEVKHKLGNKFDLKKFHEDFLSYGSAPVKEIRELMLQNLPKN
jgi:hypothetical protein